MKKFTQIALSFLIITAIHTGCENDSQDKSAAPKNYPKAITSFSIINPPSTGIIDEAAHQITVILPYGSSMTGLTADFAITGSSVKINDIYQESGITVNNFSYPVTYTVTAEDGSVQDYEITVTDDPYNYNTGDTGPAGGYIFYINVNAAADGWKYLEAASADLSSTYSTGCCYNHTINTGTAIGTGLQNSINIDYYKGLYGPSDAASFCMAYSVIFNGITFDDWFLPSKDELNEMYITLQLTNILSFSNNYYWSSSKVSPDSNNVYRQHFGTGIQDNYEALSFFKVHAVRRF